MIALETVRQEWEGGNRRFEQALEDATVRERLLTQLELVTDELRKRIGQTFTLDDRSNINRYTAGVRFSLLVPKIVVEVTQAEVRSYAAKISVGF